MSLVMDDLSQPPLLQAASSRVGVIGATEKNIDRVGGRVGTKLRQLRLDSPTTIEACKELGILVEDLKQKTIEDFRDPKVDDDIISLRFQHYMQRFNQNQSDVIARKRQIMKAKHKAQKLLDSSYGGGMTERPRVLVTDTGLPPLNNSGAPYTMKNSQSVAQLKIPSPNWNNYNRTMNYLRASHEVAGTKDPEDLIEPEPRDTFGLTETPELLFDTALATEVCRFNKLKRQKQKEAKDAFENEIKRVKSVQELREKAKRMQEREKKLVADRKKAEEEKKRKAEEKLEQIRDLDRMYQEQRAEEKARQKKKLEETKKKLAVEAEEKKRQIIEHEEKLEERRRIAEERRERLKIEEQDKSDRLKLEIDLKLYNSTERHNMILTDKASRVKFQMIKIEDQAKKMKEMQDQRAEENVQNLVEKLVKKEEAIRSFQTHQVQEFKKREKDLEEKNKRFDDHKSNIKQAQNNRMQEINERFQKVQDNLAHKKEFDEKNLKMKQELNRLKVFDKQENYNRQQRQIAYEREKVLQKEKLDHEKLIWLKNQREILKQVKAETTIQSKIEKERIEQGVQILSKLTKESTTIYNLTDAQKKLLKEVLTPEDYKVLEDEEKRYRDELLAIQEAKKNGLPVPEKQGKAR